MNKSIAVNIKKCLACKSCEIACAVAHSNSKVLEEAVAESPGPQRMLTIEMTEDFGVPIQCRHCDDAPCIEICPTGAVYRQSEQDPVIINEELCIGCKLCILMCPFGVLKIGRKGRAIIKCDMCYELIKQNKLPECVQACPTKALKLVSLEGTTKPKLGASSEQHTKQEKTEQ